MRSTPPASFHAVNRRRLAFGLIPLAAVYTLIALGEGLWLLAIPGVVMFLIQVVVDSPEAVLGERLHRRQPRVPLRRQPSHPRRRLLQAVRTDDVAHLATVPLRGDKAGAVEDGEVLDHRRAAHGQRGGQGGRRAVPVLRQQVEDPAARRVGERGEDVLGHTVTVCA